MISQYRSVRLLGRTLFISALLFACKGQDVSTRPDPAFSPYIPAFTAGHISATAPILIRLAEDQRWKDSSNVALQGLFKMAPSVEGTVSWQDDLTLAFRPKERLKQNTTYTVTFHLGALLEVPANLSEFKFQVTTYTQGIDVRVSDLRSLSTTDLTWQQVVANVYTSDECDATTLEGCFSATQGNKPLHLIWEHEPNNRFHRVLADSVLRGEAASHVIFSWNGAAIDCADKDTLGFIVPAIGDMRLVSAETFSDGEQYATLLFSDPLDPTQDLTGLAGIQGVDNVRLQVEGNKLLIYPTTRVSGNKQGFVAAGLVNVNGHKMGKDITVDLVFEELKPAVRMVGKGTILPSTDGLLLPFEAVNLSAVDVRVIRIYAENVTQFLQVNQLDGERELARVGRLVMKKTVPLKSAKAPDAGRWNRFYLDLDDLIKTEPGAIYRVQIGFRQAYSLYPCENATPAVEQLAAAEEITEQDEREWDSYEDYYYYDDYDYYYDDEYDYRDREDPCTPSYYGSRHQVSRNILASDLGLVAKRGNDGSVLVACADLRTTKPVPGVKVELLDLQRRSLGSLTTDGNGLARMPSTKHRPFMLVASKDGQRGYLKMDDGGSLSVSEFKVEGEAVERGLKGFLYGERGVWRPGDSLYLTFILQDAEKKLPKDHPVVFELSDPQGRLDQHIVRNTSVSNTYAFRCATSTEAPTGVWSARVNVGGTSFYKPIRIEMVKPNRLKIKLDPGGDRLTRAAVKTPVKLDANWLHGAPARELNARVTVTMTRSSPDFKGFEKFSFNDLRTDLNTEEQTVFDGRLNAEGHAEFAMDLTMNNQAPAVVKANIVTRVFEAGGDASMDRTDLPYYPYVSYAGVQEPNSPSSWGALYTDTTWTFQVVSVDATGKPLPQHKLKAQIARVDHHWWWDGDMDGVASYMSAPSTRLRYDEEITTDAKGRATVKFRVDRPEWGTFVVRVTDPASGHVAASTVYVDWPGYFGRNRRNEESQAAMLSFNSDKEKYTVGQECELVIPSNGNGSALVSIENGSRVLDAQWIELKEKETRHRFKVTAEMAPNVYAHVTLVQPHGKTSIDSETNDLPIRLYGVIPIMVEDPATHLFPVIAMASEVKTDEVFSVEVSEKSGQEMTYTLAIVDEGLLDLTRFKTPDPWNHFFAKEALGVRTWDMYDQVIGAYGRQIERVLALGGSDQAGPVDATKANRFKPVVKFVGPLKLAKGEKRKHSFTINNYVGSVRVMVVANRAADRAYGNAEKAVPVKKPLMLLATMPRVVGPGETVDLPVTLFAMDKKIKDVQLRLEANDLFTIQDGATRTATFNRTGDQVIVFRVKVNERIGVGKVKVIAEGAGERASEAIEIQVRQPNLPQTNVSEGLIDAGKNWQATPEAVGIPGTNSAYVEVSTIPPIDLTHRLAYLVGYPHGCVEQTTSKAFPQLFLGSVVDMPARMKQEAKANVEAAIGKLRGFQNTDGSFSYWPGNYYVDDWCSIYVCHFLIEAERQGYTVDPGMKSRWVSNQKRTANLWTQNDRNGWTYGRSQLTQAYRLYVLALAKEADAAGAMNRLRTMPGLGLEARWTLAAAYGVQGNTDAATKLVQGLATTVEPYTEMAYTYGSDLRDDALIVEALLRMGQSATAAGVVKRIAERLGNENAWYSTQSTAFGLMAVARFAEKSELGKGMSFKLVLDGKSEDRFSQKAVHKVELPVPDGKHTVRIENSGKNVLYVRLVRTGTPVAGAEEAASQGLAMSVHYELMDGTYLDPQRIEQGTDFVAVVNVAHPGIRGPYQQLALTQVFPSGWEIRNTRMEGTEGSDKSSWFTYQDIRDDRVMTYFGLSAGERHTYRIALNASYIGRYYMPPASCEAMYDHTVNARSEGQWITVVKAGGERAAK